MLALAQTTELFTLAEGFFFLALKTNKLICHIVLAVDVFSNFNANRELLKRKLPIPVPPLNKEY